MLLCVQWLHRLVDCITQFVLQTVFIVQVVQLIRDDILPYASKLPRDFVAKLMHILNKGSIHSVTSSSFIGNRDIIHVHDYVLLLQLLLYMVYYVIHLTL